MQSYKSVSITSSARDRASTTTTDHYTGSGDDPAWTSTSPTAWTRNLTGPDGNLAATADQSGSVTLQLADLHGDTVATAADTSTATGISAYSESTEYGAPRTPSTAFGSYGWLGATQRSSNDLAGLTLMGVRLDNPATGRFLTTDPIPGGNANAYIYPDDPINSFDLTGQCGRFGLPWVKCKTPKKTGYRASFCSNAGCINYQLSAYGRVQWGITIYGGASGTFINVQVRVNGKIVDSKPFYNKGIVHGSIIPKFLPANRVNIVTITATYVGRCYVFFTCTAHSIPNAYVVPDYH